MITTVHTYIRRRRRQSTRHHHERFGSVFLSLCHCMNNILDECTHKLLWQGTISHHFVRSFVPVNHAACAAAAMYKLHYFINFLFASYNSILVSIVSYCCLYRTARQITSNHNSQCTARRLICIFSCVALDHVTISMPFSRFKVI